MNRSSCLFTFIVGIFLATSGIAGTGEVVYFLVGETTPYHNDSYVLPLSDANEIAGARNLISGGMGFATRVVADIAAGTDGINRNFVSPMKAPWNWHVINFVSFVEVSPPELDGWPGLVQNDIESWMENTGGQIGFWNYTVVAELGTDTKSWRCDFDSDSKVNNKDFGWLSADWLREDCNGPDWCNGIDIDNSGTVDYNDLAIFADNWLDPFAAEPLWYDCWYNPIQCHGDADGMKQGPFWVSAADLAILQACYPLPVYYGAPCYNPCADFDRDGDVDDDDVMVIDTWIWVLNVPYDCPLGPFH